MRSWLYVPANKPRMLINSGLYNADGIVFDLEDSISESKKNEARFLLCEAFSQKVFKETHRGVILVVRINSLDTKHWFCDISNLIKSGVTEIRIPKVESSDKLIEIDNTITKIEKDNEIALQTIKLQVIIETPLGIENAIKIATSSRRLTGISFGAEDYCSLMRIERNAGGYELDYPRSRIANAAAIAGIEAWDSVWANFNDLQSLFVDAKRAKTLGFAGKSVIHPMQISAVNKIFSPSAKEIKWAKKITNFAKENNFGVFSLDGKMIDKPVISRAKSIISLTESSKTEVEDNA